MAIGTDDLIEKFGTPDTITTGTPGTIANDAFSAAGDVADWTNDDDAPLADFVLKCQFDTTMPTVGQIDLFTRVLNVQSTNDPNAPDANFLRVYLGSFEIDFGVAADTDFWTTIHNIPLPNLQTSQIHEFYLKNNATAQTMGQAWALYVTPKTLGPSA